MYPAASYDIEQIDVTRAACIDKMKSGYVPLNVCPPDIFPSNITLATIT